MKAYFDTAVLVAACIADHPHYRPAVTALEAAHTRKVEACVAAHGLAEFYSVLTRTPFSPPVFPHEAWQFVADNIVPVFEIVSLSSQEYQESIQRCAQSGWTGGRVYDVLHLKCAQKANCDRIYTFNVRRFRQLAPELSECIHAP